MKFSITAGAGILSLLLLATLSYPAVSPPEFSAPGTLISGRCPEEGEHQDLRIIARLGGGRCLLLSGTRLPEKHSAFENWSLEQAITPELRVRISNPERPGMTPIVLSLVGDGKSVDEALENAGIRISWIAENRGLTELGLILESGQREIFLEILATVKEQLVLADVQSGAHILNAASAWRCQSGIPAQTPIFDRGLHGESQIIALMDTGIDPGSCYFSDPERGLPPTNSDTSFLVDENQRKILAVDFWWEQDDSDPSAFSWDSQGHGTHTAGSAAGDTEPWGLYNAKDGMAPAAKLVIQDGGFQIDPCGDLPGLGCPMKPLGPMLQQAWDQGARIHSDSWGDEEDIQPYNRYTERGADMDRFVFEHQQMLIVLAAGNSGPGPDTIGSPATAKNVIAVGATTHGDFDPPCPVSFSSRGWTDDGRIKPDVMAPGASVISAGTDLRADTMECITATKSGTSMAAPTVAGLAALLRQYFTEGWFKNGRKNPDSGIEPSAALLKALLIASARDLSELGCSSIDPIPSRDQGWGLVTLDHALFFEGESRRMLFLDTAKTPPERGRSFCFETRGEGELKLVLVWSDPPSTSLAAGNLVNDLDLELEGPSGIYRGNVLEEGMSIPGGVPDRLNNVEVIRLLPAPIGHWEARIRAAEIAESPQGFALVVTGEIEAEPGARDARDSGRS